MGRLRRLLFVGWLAWGGCEDQSYREIGAEIGVIVRRDDGFVAPAQRRLSTFGRRALPQIETALHTAPLNARLRLIEVLDTIGDGEASTILRHFAVYDTKPEVRAACETVLRGWAARGEQRASQALARVAEKRAKGEGPIPPRP